MLMLQNSLLTLTAFMKEIKRTCQNLNVVICYLLAIFKIFILFLQKEKRKQSLEIYIKKNQKIHRPEGDSHIKFLFIIKATFFCIDFFVVVVTE